MRLQRWSGWPVGSTLERMRVVVGDVHGDRLSPGIVHARHQQRREDMAQPVVQQAPVAPGIHAAPGGALQA